jgi:enoyl-CoA hydratase
MDKQTAMQKYSETVTTVFGGKLPAPISGEASSASKSENGHTAGSVEQVSLEEIIFPAIADKEHLSAKKYYETLESNLESNGVLKVSLNRPKRGNALNVWMLNELNHLWRSIERSKTTRVVVLTGKPNNFCTGMDLTVFAELQKILSSSSHTSCEGRRREGLARFISFLQKVVDGPELCPVPVIAAVNGQCIGGGLDLLTACDLRFCTRDAVFCVKEIDLAIVRVLPLPLSLPLPTSLLSLLPQVADMGGLQRLPRLVGDQAASELIYTGREVRGEEAAQLGLVLRCFDDEAAMHAHVEGLAATIARKSPLTVRGAKQALRYARDHSLGDALEQVKLWNAGMLQSNDLMEAFSAAMQRRSPEYKDT